MLPLPTDLLGTFYSSHVQKAWWLSVISLRGEVELNTAELFDLTKSSSHIDQLLCSVKNDEAAVFWHWEGKRADRLGSREGCWPVSGTLKWGKSRYSCWFHFLLSCCPDNMSHFFLWDGTVKCEIWCQECEAFPIRLKCFSWISVLLQISLSSL